MDFKTAGNWPILFEWWPVFTRVFVKRIGTLDLDWSPRIHDAMSYIAGPWD